MSMGKLKNWIFPGMLYPWHLPKYFSFSVFQFSHWHFPNNSVFQFFHWHFPESFRLSVSGNCCPELVSHLLAACVAICIQHFLSLSFVRSQCIMGLRCKRHRAFRKVLKQPGLLKGTGLVLRSPSTELLRRTKVAHKSWSPIIPCS
jgi:hypothetical protein